MNPKKKLFLVYRPNTGKQLKLEIYADLKKKYKKVFFSIVYDAILWILVLYVETVCIYKIVNFSYLITGKMFLEKVWSSLAKLIIILLQVHHMEVPGLGV